MPELIMVTLYDKDTMESEPAVIAEEAGVVSIVLDDGREIEIARDDLDRALAA